MEWLLGALAAFVLGALAGPLIEPWSERIRRIGRRLDKSSFVDVHVEWDQAVIRAGEPPWESFLYFIPGSELPSTPPPEDGSEWGRWAYAAGGFDMAVTKLRVTIVARRNVTVVLDTPMVEQEVEPVPQGIGVLRPAAGGAEVSPRRYDVRLDAGGKPLVTFNDGESGKRRSAPSWVIAAGSLERLHIWAMADDDRLHRWTMTLPFLVDNRRIFHRVTRDGEPFVTVGDNHAHSYLWRPQDRWLSFRPRENS